MSITYEHELRNVYEVTVKVNVFLSDRHTVGNAFKNDICPQSLARLGRPGRAGRLGHKMP